MRKLIFSLGMTLILAGFSVSCGNSNGEVSKQDSLSVENQRLNEFLDILAYTMDSINGQEKYLYTNNGNSDEFPGPVFSIINDSQDTLYGEWLPGYFWGALSRWKDGDYVGYYVGSIDTDWVEEPPLFPGQKKKAWVASFGRITPPGKYRFRLYYTTDSPYVSKRSAGLTRETETFRWWSSVSKWYLLVCDFEIQPEELLP